MPKEIPKKRERPTFYTLPTPLVQPILNESYNFIIAIMGHSCIELEQKYIEDIQEIRPDATIKTIQTASPDSMCIANDDDIKEKIVKMFERTPEEVRENVGFFGSTPEEIVGHLLISIKPTEYDREKFIESVHKDQRADIPAFLKSEGQISKRPTDYFNRRWVFSEFDHDGNFGFVLLIERTAEGITIRNLYEEEINAGKSGPVFELTKKQLLTDVFDRMDREGKNLYKPLVIDFGCCISAEGDMSLKRYIDYGAYGGKSKRKKKKKTRITKRRLFYNS